MQRAIDACAAGGGGQVLFGSGRYLLGTIELRSGVDLHVQSGARLIGTTNLAEYRQPRVPSNLPEAKWGKWHRALIIAQDAHDFSISGEGTIDGHKVLIPPVKSTCAGPMASPS